MGLANVLRRGHNWPVPLGFQMSRYPAMPQSHSITNWIGKLKEGQSEAAQPLWERYFASLLQVARDRLQGMSRVACDEEDVALSAFHSFCQAVALHRFPQLANREDLWRLLVMHTIRKSIDQRRYQEREKRGGRVQRSDEVLLNEIVDTAPDPALAAMLAEEFSRLIQALNDEHLRSVALAKLEGFTNAEIAQRLACSQRSVYRRLTIIRSIWQDAGLEVLVP